MQSIWLGLQRAPVPLRWPIKWAVFILVTFLVLYPYPWVFARQVRHLRQLDALPDPQHPAVAELAERFEARLAATADPSDPKAVLSAVDQFVREQIPYAWDWDTWGVADYVPTLDELLAVGREDCDGRAVLAASLLRRRGIEAHLVGDFRHVWLSTPLGETMGPLEQASFTAHADGLHIRWRAVLDLGPLAVGVSLFPLARELIILMTLWLLLLPPRPGLVRAGIGGLVLFQALLLLRLAGADVLAPNAMLAWAALLHLPAAAWILRRRGAKSGAIEERPSHE